ncbi:MAG: YraN family protein [Firmicutes bacterium]|nr:YraN family protein [Bacillota bacterium]
MALKRRETGLKGEEIALSFLSSLGYRLLAKNFRCRLGEIDLIMQDGPVTVFVEVKTRRNLLYGTPQEAVSPAKQAKIRRLAQYYLLTKKEEEAPLRFDVIAITFTEKGRPVIEHLKGVF